MSGHSKWSTIKHKKAIADAKRGRIFNKIVREITVAVQQSGDNPAMNPNLRLILEKAKSNNMPSQNIQKAIKRGLHSKTLGKEFLSVIYEGYGPCGSVFIIDVLTENKQKTQPELRTIFQKNGGSLEKAGCVSWMFDSKGLTILNAETLDEENLLEIIITSGAEDYQKKMDQFHIYSAVNQLENVKRAFNDQNIAIVSSNLVRIPKNIIEIHDLVLAKQLIRLEENLKDHEDVQNVFNNFIISK